MKTVNRKSRGIFIVLLLVATLLLSACNLTRQNSSSLDPNAVEQTLKAWHKSRYSFVKMYGIYKEGSDSAVAYYQIIDKDNNKCRDARASIKYFMQKGWFIVRVELNYNVEMEWWDGVFEKVEPKKL